MVVNLIKVKDALNQILVCTMGDRWVLKLSCIKRIIQVLGVLEKVPLKFNYGLIKGNSSGGADLLIKHEHLVSLVKSECTLLVGDREDTGLGHGMQ